MIKVITFLLTFLLVQLAFASTNFTTVRKVVTTAGTEVRLVSDNTFTSSVVIMAECDNTGFIYVGDVNVTATNGIRLSACEKIAISFDPVPGKNDPIDLFKIYIDSSVNGDGVNFLYTSWK